MILAASVLILGGCVNGAGNQGAEDVTVNNAPITNVIEVKVDSVVNYPDCMSIVDWSVSGDRIICRSENTPSAFYELTADNFAIADSCGVVGQGPGEFLLPMLVASNSDRAILADGAVGKAFIKGDKDVSSAASWDVLMNSPHEIAYPVIGYTSLERDEKVWRVLNVETGEQLDSISFNKSGIMSAPVEIKTSSNGKYAVIAHQFKDEIDVISLNDDYKIAKTLKMTGEETSAAVKPYYVGVACGPESFYVLSMKPVSFSANHTPEGYPVIDEYGYDGKGIAEYKLSYYPSRMLLDSKRNRILLLGAEDDSVHILNL